MVTFQAPIGGIPYPLDFAPSILFAVLYAAMLPSMWRPILMRRSRTILLTATMLISCERVYIYIQRAIQSHNEKARFRPGFVTYMQLSYALGFIGIGSDMVHIVRCLLVNPTYGSATFHQSPAAETTGGSYGPPPAGTPDQPRLRRMFRRLSSILSLSLLGALATGIAAQVYYPMGYNNQAKANTSQHLRLSSAIIALSSSLSLIYVVIWRLRRSTSHIKRAIAVAISVSVLMAVVGIYRISVINVTATALTEPMSSNDRGAKAAFYICHSLPEWLAILILYTVDVRQMFGTGPFGDSFRDMGEVQSSRPNEIPLIEKEVIGESESKTLENVDV